MSWFGEIGRRLRMLGRRASFRRDLDEEMLLHREMKERELAASGVPANEARYAANRAFGNATALRQLGRDAWGWHWLQDPLQDCWFRIRGLRKEPGFAATALITLIFGVGATTAIFSIVNTVLLRPLPYTQPGRLVRIEENHAEGAGFPGSFFAEGFSYANWLDLQAAHHKSLEATGAYREWTFNIGRSDAKSGAEPLQADGAMVSPGLFALLGVAPDLGRGFTALEQHHDAANVAVLSYVLWQSQFA